MHRDAPENLRDMTKQVLHSDAVLDWRKANAAQIATALRNLRSRTLAVFDAYAAAGMLQVPYADELNPPLWELGHVGWYQEVWIGRNQQRGRGVHCDPDHTRAPSLLTQGDSWYNSSTIAHDARWHLSLLGPQDCKDYLAATLEQTVALLNSAGEGDDALYFYRLVMFHEAMHLEAAIYMAQALGVPLETTQVATNSIAAHAHFHWPKSQISIKSTIWILGSESTGFAFDNELGAHTAQLKAFDIDSHCVRWQQYLAFVEATGHALPRYVRRTNSSALAATTAPTHVPSANYEGQVFGRWQALDMQKAAVHLSQHDADAYCAWVGRRLPTEAEWECTAISRGSPHDENKQPHFVWGEVWEWTASIFNPYPDFVAHPYRDYSQPWFGSRPVLRGACTATQPLMRNPKYRNYFM
jgi:gamma-glutamyl hercynylcysteine S-oxide synthase